ncbi:MAG: erythromycin esterase family protein [Aureispira sp.]
MRCLKITLASLSLLLFLTQCTNPPTTPEDPLTGKELFVEWGKDQIVPFDFEQQSSLDSLVEAMAEDIDDARVVMLSEGFHNCEEMLALQYELVSYLVEHKGFNIVATESGLPESKYVNDYIHGGDTIPNFWQKSLDILYSEWKQGRVLINWLSEYNQSHTNQVDYYGADIGGGYQDWEFPFQQVFTYLDTVDVSTAKKLEKELDFYFNIMKPYAAYYYVTRLSREQKNDLAFLLDDLIQTFTDKEKLYIERSNRKDYVWVLQCIKSMRMAEHYYRNYTHVNDTTHNKVALYLGANGREIAMAQNIKWMLQEKEDAKMIIINHVIHTKTASQHQGDFYQHFTPMGQLLKQKLGEELFIIGMTYGSGYYWKLWQMPESRSVDTIPPTAVDGLEQTFASIAPQDYYIRLDEAPLLTYNWLHENTSIRENDYSLAIKPSEWNACFYLHEVTPAVAADTVKTTITTDS